MNQKKPPPSPPSSTTLDLQEDEQGCVISVRVTPGASLSKIEGVVEGRLRIRLQAAPVEGAANRALEAFLASKLDVAKSRVLVIRGSVSREKQVLLEDCTKAQVLAALIPKASAVKE